MINQQLINPKSIAVVGGSDDIHKPGGKILYNLLQGNYTGKLYVANPKSAEVQGIKSYQNLDDIPQTDLAILAIPAKFCTETVRFFAEKKSTKAFIIISAGFSETSKEGAKIEHDIVEIVEKHNAVLIGPNGIGVLTPHYHGVFTSPVPKLDAQGVDFISGSGATAVFIMELGIPNGLRFANVFSVGNSAQIGVEEVLEYMDLSFDAETSSKVKLLYIEQIDKPQKLLKHARSLIQKGCRIAAVKSGSSDAGSRAASSHTGALASSDTAVNALFRKAGIVRAYGRQELITLASVFMYPELTGKNIAVITHAGGPAVMLTDALEKGGLQVPQLNPEETKPLSDRLFTGSSLANPIDFLATGTAEQLGEIIDFCDTKLPDIDAMVVIFGTPGLVKVFDAYAVLSDKIRTCKKPIFPVLPSITEADAEIQEFISKGHVFFPEEVLLGEALSKIYFSDIIEEADNETVKLDKTKIRTIIDTAENGYLPPEKVQKLLDAAGINRAKEFVCNTETALKSALKNLNFPIVMKVVGPVHKSDAGGVALNVSSENQAVAEFNRIIKIKDASGVLLQPMLSGTELFAGAKREDKFGHLILAGTGGIFIEVFKDVSSALVPVSKFEAKNMIESLKSYPLIKGTRGQTGINQSKFEDVILRLSALLEIAPEIAELDLNPLLATSEDVIAADARIRIEK